jgi:hypothetical protein
MMSLVHLPLSTGIEIIYPHPGVRCTARDESISEERVKGCVSRRGGQGDGDGWVLARRGVSVTFEDDGIQN